jgi:hypothetical protein
MNRWTVLILFHVEVKKVAEEGTIADDNSRFRKKGRGAMWVSTGSCLSVYLLGRRVEGAR